MLDLSAVVRLRRTKADAHVAPVRLRRDRLTPRRFGLELETVTGAMYNVRAGIVIRSRPTPAEVFLKKVFPFTILATLISGCAGGLIRSEVEKGVRHALPDYIGPARSYSVNVHGDSAAILKGRIERLEIEGEDVQVDPKLSIGHLYVDMRNVRCDVKTRALKTVEQASVDALISEAAVNRYIVQTRGDSSLTVKLEPGKILVQFLPKVLGVGVPIAVSGTPVIVGGDKINFQADSASLGRLPVPAPVVNKALDAVNPVLDLSTMRFPVILRDIIIEKGNVRVKGNAEFKLGG